jgi:hypothetical protein
MDRRLPRQNFPLNLPTNRRLCSTVGGRIVEGWAAHCSAVSAARSRAATMTNLARSSLALVLHALFGAAKSCALVNLFMICPRWSASGQPTTNQILLLITAISWHSVCVIACPAFADRAYWLASAIVPMAEFGKASSFESVIVSHNPPNIQIVASTTATCDDLLQRNAVLAALPRNGAGGDYDSSFFFLLKRKITKSAVLVHLQADTPRNIASRQIAGILDTDVAKNATTIADKMNTEWLNGQIGALKDSGVFFLPFSGFFRGRPQIAVGLPQCEREQRDKNCCKSSNSALVLPNEQPETILSPSEQDREIGGTLLKGLLAALILGALYAGLKRL